MCVLVQRVAFFKGAARAADEGGVVDVGRMQGLVTRYTNPLSHYDELYPDTEGGLKATSVVVTTS